MMKADSLRFRMMVLFCTVVGVLLAVSYLAFWVLLARVVDTHFNRQLLETARPVIANLIREPTEQDINLLDLPGEFFELLDPAGHVLQHSKNLPARLERAQPRGFAPRLRDWCRSERRIGARSACPV